MDEVGGSGTKDIWDKLHIILAPVGGLLTAIAVASLGVFGSRALDRQQNNEAKLRLFSELLSRREESEATLRKEMFQSIVGSFFDSTSSSLESKLLKMELLAENFHEALDLTPLFRHIRREIDGAHLATGPKRAYEERLSDLETEVTRKQMIVLEAGGARHDWTLVMSDSLPDGTYQPETVALTLDGLRRRFRVTPLRVDTAQRKLRIRLEIDTPAQPNDSANGGARNTVEFDLGSFSTPMIDNTRLSNDQRVAVVLTDLNSAGAAMSLLYFPGSRASLRERPYYEEILRKLTDTTHTP
jgi:hypothetical protein